VQSVHVVAPVEVAKDPAAQGVHVEPLKKLPALHVAVPEKLTPRLPRIQLVLATVLPSAMQRSTCPSYAVEGVAKEYTVEATEDSVGDSVAATQFGLGPGA
jgi:hypothetical protein